MPDPLIRIAQLTEWMVALIESHLQFEKAVLEKRARENALRGMRLDYNELL
jgi:hypothetical protein